MSQIDVTGNGGTGGRKKAGVKRVFKHSLKVDMTPMVDLGFLLITFFIFTTQLSRPTAVDLYMPKEGPPTDLPKSNAFTILLDHNKIYYYSGEWPEAVQEKAIKAASFSGKNSIRDVILARLEYSAKMNLHNEGRDGLMVLLKPSANSSYKYMMDLLDEMLINRVKKYAILKTTTEELDWLKKAEQP